MLIYGRKIREQLKQEVTTAARIKPLTMAIIKIGDNRSSASYVRGIVRFASETGIEANIIRLPGDSTEQEIIDLIDSLNHDANINGIMVQTPLPSNCDVSRVINSIDPDKDVEGIHNCNLGKLISREQGVRPCTPSAVIRMLKTYGIPLEGSKVTIIGRSMVVGSPLAVMMTAEDATVTLCHEKTKDLSSYTRTADIIVVAVGEAGFITPDMVSAKTVIMDVGINFDDAGKMVGDVSAEAQAKAHIVSAVPGGIGVITVAELFMNLTYLGCKNESLTDIDSTSTCSERYILPGLLG